VLKGQMSINHKVSIFSTWHMNTKH